MTLNAGSLATRSVMLVAVLPTTDSETDCPLGSAAKLVALTRRAELASACSTLEAGGASEVADTAPAPAPAAAAALVKPQTDPN
jgi:hypothetical protein